MRKKTSAAAAAFQVILLVLCIGFLGLTIMVRRQAPEQNPVADDQSTQAVQTGSPAVETKQPASDGETPAPAALQDYSGELRISEMMSRNRSAVMSPSGVFCDWIELENISDVPVSLSGWSVGTVEGTDSLALGDTTLQPGELCTVYVKDTADGSFTFGSGDTVVLTDPAGIEQDSVLYVPEDNNTAYALGSDGSFTATLLATPGYENTSDGYSAFMDTRSAEGPLVISEVTVSNSSYAQETNGDYCDWIEIKNISSSAVNLSDYYLSDSRSDYLLYQLPDVTLEAGGYYLVWCSDDVDDADHTKFGLNTYNENLFLSDSTHIIDYVFLHDVPVNGSCGRMDGRNGFFYFDTPTPLEANTNGCRFVLDEPSVSIPAGTYDNVEGSITVELTGSGTIYYTTDGSVPTTASSVYTSPIDISANTVIRCFSAENGYATSRVANYTYLINENVTLPVLSLVVDNLATFNGVYNAGAKAAELSANLTLYDDTGTAFSANCGVSLAGWTSLQDAKKSFNIDFRSCYGDSKLTGTDIFGNGITEYDALCVRAGQDYKFAVIRDELCQDLALELPDSHILTQASRYCILYINGEYRGIYALKENICEQFYASHYGFDEDTVTQLHAPVSLSSEYYEEVISFIYENDLSVEENYEYLCSVVDIDNLIDWIIMEGWCANTDTVSNLRYFKSTEDGLWRVAFYDLDWSFWYTDSRFVNVYSGVGNSGQQMTSLLNRLLYSKPFREKFLTRFAECISTTLSNENVLAKIDELYEIVEPEVSRDRSRWYLQLRYFYERIDELQTFITYNDWANACINTVCSLYGISRSTFDSNYLNNVGTAS